jgi:hypothetical protein
VRHTQYQGYYKERRLEGVDEADAVDEADGTEDGTEHYHSITEDGTEHYHSVSTVSGHEVENDYQLENTGTYFAAGNSSGEKGSELDSDLVDSQKNSHGMMQEESDHHDDVSTSALAESRQLAERRQLPAAPAGASGDSPTWGDHGDHDVESSHALGGESSVRRQLAAAASTWAEASPQPVPATATQAWETMSCSGDGRQCVAGSTTTERFYYSNNVQATNGGNWEEVFTCCVYAGYHMSCTFGKTKVDLKCVIAGTSGDLAASTQRANLPIWYGDASVSTSWHNPTRTPATTAILVSAKFLRCTEGGICVVGMSDGRLWSSDDMGKHWTESYLEDFWNNAAAANLTSIPNVKATITGSSSSGGGPTSKLYDGKVRTATAGISGISTPMFVQILCKLDSI